MITVQVCCWAVNGSDYSIKYDFVVDNIYYRFNSDHNSVAVTYNNKNYINKRYMDLDPAYSGEVTIPESVTYENTVYPVTRIDVYAFYWCRQLTAVHLPNTITEIGDRAFERTGLSEIEFPNSLAILGDGAFLNCTGIKSVKIPEKVKSVDGFAGCSALETVELPAGLETIEDQCFSGCKSLKNVTLPNNLKRIGSSSFRNCSKIEKVTIPESVTSIGKSAFSGCSALNTVNILCDLREIDISDEGQVKFLHIPTDNSCIFSGCRELNIHVTHPDNAISLLMTNAFNEQGSYNAGTKPHFYVNNVLMTDFEIPDIFGGIIPSSLFIGVSDMKTVTLPQNTKEIGKYAFRYCSSLEKIYFPETLETIGDQAFCDCTSLKEIKFGKKIKEINNEAFANCTALEKVDIGDLRNWCSISFPGGRIESGLVPQGSKTNNPLAYAKKIYLNGKELDELIIPDGITTINPHVFNNCQRFDKLVIPSSVTTIGDYAFSSCGDLDNIVLKSPVNLQSLGAGSFAKCISLTNVTIPDCVTSLGTGAFRECTNLVNIKLPAGLTKLPANMFVGCTSLPSVTLPEGVEEIGNWAFQGCTSLTRIDIPKAVGIIGTEAFQGCTGMNGVYIQDIAAWCGIDFGNLQYQAPNWEPDDKLSNPLIYAHNLYLNGEIVTDLVIPDGVKTIEQFAFWGATCIESVTIPKGVEKIGCLAFQQCSSITSIKIPSSVKSIERQAFCNIRGSQRQTVKLYLEDIESWLANNLGLGFGWASNAYDFGAFIEVYLNNERLKDIVIPKTINSLHKWDFAWMKLNSVTIHENVNEIGDELFRESQFNYLYLKSKFAPTLQGKLSYYFIEKSRPIAFFVPKGRGDIYKSKWSNYADIIKEADQEVTGEQSAESISEIVDACAAINGAATYLNLTNATLDETVTAEALGAGEDNVLYYLPSGTNVTGDNIVVDGVAESVCLHDGVSLEVPMEFTANSVSLLCTLSAGGSYTICLPYDFTLPEGMKAYSLDAEGTDGKLQFTEVESLKANEPYLIVSSLDVESLNAANVKMKVTPEEMNDAGNSDYEFRGTLQGLSYEEACSLGAYVLQDNFTWVPVANQKPDSEENSARAYNVRSRSYADPSADDIPSIGVSACHAYLVPKSGNAGASIETMLKNTNGVLLGDANGDGEITISDAVLIISYVVGENPSGFNMTNADVNKDGKVTIADAVKVIDMIKP